MFTFPITLFGGSNAPLVYSLKSTSGMQQLTGGSESFRSRTHGARLTDGRLVMLSETQQTGAPYNRQVFAVVGNNTSGTTIDFNSQSKVLLGSAEAGDSTENNRRWRINSIQPISNTKIIACYSAPLYLGSASRVVTGTLDNDLDNTITWSTTGVFPPNLDNYVVGVIPLNSTYSVIYGNGTATGVLIYKLVNHSAGNPTVVGTAEQAGTLSPATNTSIGGMHVCKVRDDAFIAVQVNDLSNPKAQMVTVSGNTISTPETEVTLSNITVSSVSGVRLKRIEDNKILMIYKNLSGFVEATILTISGTTITDSNAKTTISSVQASGSGAFRENLGINDDATQALAVYHDSTASRNLRMAHMTIDSGTNTVTATFDQQFNTDVPNNKHTTATWGDDSIVYIGNDKWVFIRGTDTAQEWECFEIGT